MLSKMSPPKSSSANSPPARNSPTLAFPIPVTMQTASASPSLSSAYVILEMTKLEDRFLGVLIVKVFSFQLIAQMIGNSLVVKLIFIELK